MVVARQTAFVLDGVHHLYSPVVQLNWLLERTLEGSTPCVRGVPRERDEVLK